MHIGMLIQSLLICALCVKLFCVMGCYASSNKADKYSGQMARPAVQVKVRCISPCVWTSVRGRSQLLSEREWIALRTHFDLPFASKIYLLELCLINKSDSPVVASEIDIMSAMAQAQLRAPGGLEWEFVFRKGSHFSLDDQEVFSILLVQDLERCLHMVMPLFDLKPKSDQSSTAPLPESFHYSVHGGITALRLDGERQPTITLQFIGQGVAKIAEPTTYPSSTSRLNSRD